MKVATDLFQVDRTAFSVCDGWEQAEREDREYWFSQSPAQRWAALELIRRVTYGYDDTPRRVHRVIESVEQARR